jgi:Rrf2 family transcriptional regulator, cysteine metabolism repressor
VNFTQKEDYGLRAVLDIAAQTSGNPVQAREIASRQKLPEQFLEQVLSALRRAEVVRSVRGVGGGYTLAMPADRLTVGMILRALSGPLVPTELVEGDTSSGRAEVVEIPEVSVVRGVWGEVRAAIRGVADSLTIAQLLERRAALSSESFLMMHI